MGLCSGRRSLHFPPRGEATGQRPHLPVRSSGIRGTGHSPGAALMPELWGSGSLSVKWGTPARPDPSQGCTRSHREGRWWGEGFGPCSGPGAGSPRVTPNGQLLQPAREGGEGCQWGSGQVWATGAPRTGPTTPHPGLRPWYFSPTPESQGSFWREGTPACHSGPCQRPVSPTP